MKYREVTKRLRAAGTSQNRKVYARHGVHGEMYGVSYGNLSKVEREAKRSLEDEDLHELAVELWESGNHDARVLAVRLADPAKMRSRELDRWVGGVDNYVVASAFASLVSRSSLALGKSKKWSASPREFVSQAGWNILTELLLADADLDEAFLGDRLCTMERSIHCARNRVRYAMNNTLIALALRSKDWQRRCLEAARRIGPVDVDHGQTGCKTPDAARAIRKAVKHRADKIARRKKKASVRKKSPAGARRAAIAR